jgi:ribosomal protein L37AE/L43A
VSGAGVPYVCPFCGELDLRPVEQGRWHCRSCLRVFAVQFFGVVRPGDPAADARPLHDQDGAA